MSDLDRLLERDLSRVAALGDGSPPPDVPAIRRRGVQRRRRQTVVAVAAAVTLVLLVGGLVTRPGSGRERDAVSPPCRVPGARRCQSIRHTTQSPRDTRP